MKDYDKLKEDESEKQDLEELEGELSKKAKDEAPIADLSDKENINPRLLAAIDKIKLDEVVPAPKTNKSADILSKYNEIKSPKFNQQLEDELNTSKTPWAQKEESDKNLLSDISKMPVAQENPIFPNPKPTGPIEDPIDPHKFNEEYRGENKAKYPTTQSNDDSQKITNTANAIKKVPSNKTLEEVSQNPADVSDIIKQLKDAAPEIEARRKAQEEEENNIFNDKYTQDALYRQERAHNNQAIMEGIAKASQGLGGIVAGAGKGGQFIAPMAEIDPNQYKFLGQAGDRATEGLKFRRAAAQE
jgi:hypothetical protein